MATTVKTAMEAGLKPAVEVPNRAHRQHWTAKRTRDRDVQRRFQPPFQHQGLLIGLIHASSGLPS